MWIYNNRSALAVIDGKLQMVPQCAICGEDFLIGVHDADMHEALITRGQAERSPYDEYVKIFVAVNCVLVCPGKCHQIAQHTQEGWELCLKNILKYHTKADIYSWLDKLTLTIRDEVRRRVEDYI